MQGWIPPFSVRTCFLIAIAGLLVSCDTPQKRALRELTRAGIAPTGSALVEAVTEQNRLVTDTLLTAGVHTEHMDSKGRTPLRITIENGDSAIAKLLIGRRVNLDALAPDGSSILGVAIELNQIALVEKLLKAGARSDTTMPNGEKILPWAIQAGRSDLISLMMKFGPDPHSNDRAGSPLLHVAMNANRRELVGQLIQLGADPGQVNGRGETTLHVAIRNRWLDVIPMLITAGADPNLPGPFGPSPLGQAVMDGDLVLTKLLLKCGADPNYRHPHNGDNSESVLRKSPLELAFEHSDRRVLATFLDADVKLDRQRSGAWLWSAFSNRDLPLARLLLSKGADVNARSSKGWLLVEAAVIRGDGNFVKLFSDYGGKPGRTLHLAIARGDSRMTELLLALGADPDSIHAPFLDRPLSFAIRSRKDESAVALIKSGASLQFQVPEGQFPLHLAVATGCHETVRSLLAEGADPNTPFQLPVSADFIRQVRPGVMRWALKMDRNVSLLMVAADSGVTSTARYLIDAGAKKSAWTRVSSLWPINFASRRGDVKMMRLILGRDPHREERRIVVNLGEQRARMFDAAGNEIFNTKISSGRKGFATPTGEFVITNKHRDWTSTIYHASMPYFQRLSCSDFGLHAGNVPGYPASHGCIRVPAENAAKLFAMTQAGDRVCIVP